MNVLLQPLAVFFAAAQRGLNLLRRAGLMGTTYEPLYFEAGEPVPWWIECRWPLDSRIEFGADVETFWEDGRQRVYPLDSNYRCLLRAYRTRLIVGAPTELNMQPRPRRPRKAPKLQLSLTVAT